MLTRKVRVQIAAFLAVALVGVSYAGARYAGLDRLFGPRGYVVTVQLASSGGIFPNAEVTYRGVQVGRVGELELTREGVEVPLDIEPSAPRIPADVRAVVANRSVVGEQYVDLRPKSSGGPYLHDGSVVRKRDTTTPLPVEDLLGNVNDLVESVPEDSLRTVVRELGTAFEGNGDELQRVLDTTDEFTAEAAEHLPQTRKLLADTTTVLDTQNDQASAVRSFSADLRLVAEQLEKSDGDIRAVLDRGAPAAEEVGGALRRTGPKLSSLMASGIPTARALEDNAAGLEQMFVTYPAVSAGGFTVAPGDGSAHFGLVLNAFDPMPCVYEGTERRAGDELTPVPLNSDARCEVPEDSPTAVRGSRNAPGGRGAPGGQGE
ncbi:MCE family protein [Actinopolyspora saharensis]|uniref:Phospholipid/cholesterol/gamma-HCH transport system substrate-binding protein n=1 Tax=Actinopolyspora saharensis TaxID=995062 RepID=A0A1H1GHT2_9ACTN|nr:MlaD family protein [Actinopolyspora saharensis]SDR12822.1 phospholipid/cholesterol/gamma-HCH transport system substrate-binding protein [Actinopolyspora saharensis]